MADLTGKVSQEKGGKEEEGVDKGGPESKFDGWAIGTRVLGVAAFDGEEHLAEVVGKRVRTTTTCGAEGAECNEHSSLEYYVHFIEHNKRLDEWIRGDKLKLSLNDPRDTQREKGVGLSPSHLSPDQKMTRNLKRKFEEVHHMQRGIEDMKAIERRFEREHEEKTRVKNIQIVTMGRYEIDAWYFSPYPLDAMLPKHQKGERTGTNGPEIQRLFVCSSCFKYGRKAKTVAKHEKHCLYRHNPPGREIYFDEEKVVQGKTLAQLRVFEVDGAEHKLYCQNLCLFSKLFLDHKTLYYDVDSFFFYILCERDAASGRMQVAGYFSKEKNSAEHYNCACILTFPPYQRKNYGSIMIKLSYEISRREGKFGTPERPLSDMGLVCFRTFWRRSVLRVLSQMGTEVSLKELAEHTGFRVDDIIATLKPMNLVRHWKGQAFLAATRPAIQEYLRQISPPVTRVYNDFDPNKLNYVVDERP